MMHGCGKSDFAIVAVKLVNKAGRLAAESAERRAGTKGKAAETRYQSSLQRQSASLDQTISMVSATPIRMTADHKFSPSQSLQIGDFDDKSCSPGIVHCFPCGRSAPPQQPARTGGVRVKGVGDLLVRFAKCCHPIPGDPIQGFITRGKGITVHLRSCPTVLNEREISRLIDVEWEAAPAQTYPIAIRVEAYDRTGLLSDITQVMAENKVNILSANVGVNPDHTAVVAMTLQVASVAQLAKVMSRVEQLKDVLSVQRDLG